MHLLHVLAAFFALMFSFGHTAGSAQPGAADNTTVAESTYAAPITDPVPSYDQIRRGTFVTASYAGHTCGSCTKTDVEFIVR